MPRGSFRFPSMFRTPAGPVNAGEKANHSHRGVWEMAGAGAMEKAFLNRRMRGLTSPSSFRRTS